MPNQDTANIRPNLWDVFIDDAAAPFSMFVNKGEHFSSVPITTQRYGTTPIAMLIEGHMCQLSFEFQEWTVYNLKLWDGIVAETAPVNKLQAVGSRLPTHSIRLHNPADGADTSRDLVFPAVCFQSHAFNSDGTKELKNAVTGTAIRDTTSGDVVQLGYTA